MISTVSTIPSGSAALSIVLVENVRRNGRSEWTLPGGVLDPGETLLGTAGREVEEESGARVVEWGGFAYAVHRILEPLEIQLVVHVFVAAAWEGPLRAADPDGIVQTVEITPRDRLAVRMPDSAFHEPLLAWLDDPAPHLYEYGWSGGGGSVRR